MSQVNINVDNGIMNITLNRPEVRNAFHPEMIEELTDAFYEASEDDDVIAVLLKGEGKSFCSGADLSWMKSMVDFDYEANKEDSGKLFEMFNQAYQCEKPIVGHIHGHAMGGALGLIAICDFALAEKGTKFGFTEVKLGLVPAVISSFVIRKLNKGWAQRLMVGGEIFSTHDAYHAGLIQYSGSAEEVQNKISEYLEGIQNSSSEAISQTKKLLKFIETNEDKKIKQESIEVISQRRVSEDGQKRLKNFLNKKK